MVVEHLPVLGAAEGAEAVPVPALLLLLPNPGHVPRPNHFRVDESDWLACWPVVWHGPGYPLLMVINYILTFYLI